MTELQKDKFLNAYYERALLSYCFESIDNYYVIMARLSAVDFLLPEHNLICMIMTDLVEKKKIPKIEYSIVVGEADRLGVLKQIGGYQYVNAIMSMEVSLENIQFYIQKTLDNSIKYQLYQRLSQSVANVYDTGSSDNMSAMDMIGNVTNKVMELSMSSRSLKEAINLSDGLEDYVEERRINPVKICGISTGYATLDKRIDGLIPGTLTVVCARPKHGKSTFLSNIGRHVAYDLDTPVLYIDTEMSFDQWRTRILSMMSRVPERLIRHGGYSDYNYSKIMKSVAITKKYKYFHEYMPGYSIDKLSAIFKKYKHVENIGLAIFDYIKAPPGVHFRDKKEYQILGDVTTVLKDLAGELNIPFLCANQINRQDDIADSDRILRYADVLSYFKKKEDIEIENHGISAGNYKLIIKDSRRGGVTTQDGIGFDFHKSTLSITEAEVQMMGSDYSEDTDDKESNFSNEDLLGADDEPGPIL